MSTLTLIYAITPDRPLPSAGALRAAHLPERVQVLLVCPPDYTPQEALWDGAVLLRAHDNLWQAGLAAAEGDYVQFLRGGDLPLPFAHAAALDKAELLQADALRCAALPLRDAETVTDLPGYTLSAIDPGILHRPLTLGKDSPLLALAPDPRCWLFRRAWLNGQLVAPGSDFALWRLLCRAGRFFVCRDEALSLTETQPELTPERFRRLESALSAEDPAPAEQILSAAWSDLLAAQDPEWLADFATAYRGRCESWLEPQWRAARREVWQTPPAPRTFPLRHARCERPKVSVAVPIYNVQDYLNQALWSLQQQTMEELEFLCVNDGSTDHSLTIVREYAARDARFVILDGPNGGYGKAVNRGMDAARGTYFAILEPDDYLSPDMFRKLVQRAKRDRLDFVKSNFFRFYVDENNHAVQRRMYVTREPGWFERVIDPTEEQGAFHLAMKTWNGIYSLDFLRKNGIRHHETPGASYQDNGFWFQTMAKAHRVMFLPYAYYRYRQDNPSSSINSTEKLWCMSEEYQFIQDWLTEQGLWDTFSGIFQAKKFHNFSTTYRRIAQRYRQEYLRHIREQFLPAQEAGLLREECFEPLLWKQLTDILADPEEFGTRIRVSVILPVYNCAACLPRCLDSILERNDLPIEVICVDDGSTDDSPAILAGYAARDSRVQVYRQENAGAGAARNLGMTHATGDYLSFLDADDFFDPELLRKAYHKAYLDESDIVVFRSMEYYEDTGKYLRMRSNIREEYLPDHTPFAGVDVPENLFRLFVGWAWDKLFRADYIRRTGLRFQEQRTTNDLFFTYSAVAKAQRISTMNNVLAYHRKAAGSLSVTREQSWDCCCKALLALREQLRDWGLYERFERDFINYALHFSLWNLTTLRGAAYYKLYNALTGAWLAELGVTDKPRRYFYQAEQYDILRHLLETDPEVWLFDRLDGSAWALDEAGRENRRLRRRLDELEARLEQERNATRQQRQQAADLRRQLKEAKAEAKAAAEQARKAAKPAPSPLRRALNWLRRLLGRR